MDLLRIEEAAKFLGMTVRAVKHHIYDGEHDLVPDGKMQGDLVFKISTLKKFQARKLKRGQHSTKGGAYGNENEPTLQPTSENETGGD